MMLSLPSLPIVDANSAGAADAAAPTPVKSSIRWTVSWTNSRVDFFKENDAG